MTQTPTDALRLVPVEPNPEMLAAFWRQKNTGSQEPGQTGEDRSDYAAYRAMIAAAPASPLPEAGQLSKNLGQLKSGQCSGISGELNPELFAENANKSEGKMRDDRTTELPDFLTALFDEWGEEDYGEAATKIARAFLARNGKGEG